MSTARTIYEMKITEIIDHTPEIRELVIKTINPEQFSFRAGQFVMLHVPQIEKKPVLRAYSIASDDRQKDGFRLIFKFIESGIASNYVWSLKGQEKLQFTGPFGKVFFQEPPTEQIIFLNTGSGITQHLCFLWSNADKYPNLKCHLYFGVRKEQDIYYEANLKLLQKKMPNFHYHYVLSRAGESWTGKRGYVQDQLKEIDYKTTPTTFYLCGNGGMIKAAKAQLLDIDGIDKSRVWAEAFD